jgi:fumarate reductase flavoprotein subunit
MHGLPSRTGRELIDRLRNAAELGEIVVMTGCITQTLFAEHNGPVRGVEIDARWVRFANLTVIKLRVHSI